MATKAEQLFGRRLRELREARGLTQAALGERCSLSTKYIGAVERGEQNPTIRVAEQLARGLDVGLGDLVVSDHLESPEDLRRELQEKIATASEQQLRLLYQLVRIVAP